MPDYSVEQELLQFGEGSLTFLEPRFLLLKALDIRFQELTR